MNQYTWSRQSAVVIAAAVGVMLVATFSRLLALVLLGGAIVLSIVIWLRFDRRSKGSFAYFDLAAYSAILVIFGYAALRMS